MSFLWRRLVYLIKHNNQTLLCKMPFEAFEFKRRAELFGSEHTQFPRDTFKHRKERGILPAVDVNAPDAPFGVESVQDGTCRRCLTSTWLSVQPAVDGLSAFGDWPKAYRNFL